MKIALFQVYALPEGSGLWQTKMKKNKSLDESRDVVFKWYGRYKIKNWYKSI